MPTNYKQLYAIRNKNKKIILEHCSTAKDISGIYVFYRDDEEKGKCAYIGQAVKVLSRLADHLSGREQHIDKSLYVRGWKSQDKPYSWEVKVICYCNKELLDELETKYINLFKEKGYTLYNVTGGGQINKQGDINLRCETNLKRYRTGVEFGKRKAKEQVQVFFDKYLDYSIKPPTNKIKEKKLKEFEEFLRERTKNENDAI